MSADAKEEWVSARDDRKDTERVLMNTSEVIAETTGKLLDAIHEMRAQLKMPMFEKDENASSDDQLLRFGRLGDEYESLLPQVDALTGGNEQEEMEEPEEEEKEEPEEEEDVPAAGGGRGRRGGGGSTSGGGGINPNQGNGKGKRKRRQH